MDRAVRSRAVLARWLRGSVSDGGSMRPVPVASVVAVFAVAETFEVTFLTHPQPHGSFSS